MYMVDTLLPLICRALPDLTILKSKLQYDVCETPTLLNELSCAVWDEFCTSLLATLDPIDYSPLPSNTYIEDLDLRHDVIRALSLMRKASEIDDELNREMGGVRHHRFSNSFPDHLPGSNKPVQSRDASEAKSPRYSDMVLMYLVGSCYLPVGYIKCILQSYRQDHRELTQPEMDSLDHLLLTARHHLKILYQYLFTTSLRTSSAATIFDSHYHTFVQLGEYI